jgi:hypothetical protein
MGTLRVLAASPGFRGIASGCEEAANCQAKTSQKELTLTGPAAKVHLMRFIDYDAWLTRNLPEDPWGYVGIERIKDPDGDYWRVFVWDEDKQFEDVVDDGCDEQEANRIAERVARELGLPIEV